MFFAGFGVFSAIASELEHRKYVEAFNARVKREQLVREKDANSPYAGKYITDVKTSIPNVRRGFEHAP